MDSLKQEFVKEFDEKVMTMKYLVLAIRLPNGAIELITNTMDFQEKFQYIMSAYDKDMKIYNNISIQIVNWMIV